MRPMAVALAAAFAVSAIPAANAQTNPRLQRVERAPPGSTTYITRDEQGRTRTKILVQKRSYLDGGTEVMPGDNIDPYRSSFLRHRPAGVLLNTGFDRPSTLSDPFFLPGKNNPYPFSGN